MYMRNVAAIDEITSSRKEKGNKMKRGWIELNTYKYNPNPNLIHINLGKTFSYVSSVQDLFGSGRTAEWVM